MHAPARPKRANAHKQKQKAEAQRPKQKKKGNAPETDLNFLLEFVDFRLCRILHEDDSCLPFRIECLLQLQEGGLPLLIMPSRRIHDFFFLLMQSKKKRLLHFVNFLLMLLFVFLMSAHEVSIHLRKVFIDTLRQEGVTKAGAQINQGLKGKEKDREIQ